MNPSLRATDLINRACDWSPQETPEGRGLAGFWAGGHAETWGGRHGSSQPLLGNHWDSSRGLVRTSDLQPRGSETRVTGWTRPWHRGWAGWGREQAGLGSPEPLICGVCCCLQVEGVSTELISWGGELVEVVSEREPRRLGASGGPCWSAPSPEGQDTSCRPRHSAT